MNFFNPDSKLMITLGKAADFMILGVIWFICSIPIITIGASTTAFYYAAFKVLSNDAHVIKAFFRSFKMNFKQSTLLWLTALIFLWLGVSSLIFYYNVDSDFRVIGLALMVLVMLLYLFTMLYLFPYVSKFYCTFKKAIVNSLLLSIRHLPSTILIVFLDVAMVLATFYFTALFMFLPTIICALNSMVLMRVFKRYIPEDSDASEDDEHFMTIDEIEAMDAALAEEKAKMISHMQEDAPSEEEA